MRTHAISAIPSRRSMTWRDSFRLLRASAPVAVAASAFVFASFAPRQAAATEYYWDPNGATSEGGSGTWDTATPNWALTSTATASTTTYDNGMASIAHFGTVAGTVTIANGLAINVNTLTFDLTGGQNTGYTIAGGTGSTLNFSGTTPSVVSNSGTQETITAAVTGTAGLTETNATTSGSNSSTTANGYAFRLQGDLSGLSGTVNVGNGNTTNGGGYIALGTGAANYTSSQFQTWNIAANGLLTGNNQGTGYTYSLGALSGAGILRGGSSNGGVPAGTDTFQIGALNTSTAFSGTIVDKATGSVLTAMTKVGTGTLTLSGTNTYTGGTTVSAGTLALNGADNGTGVVRGVVTVNSNATLSLVSRNALGYSNTTVSVTTLNVVGGTVDNAAPTNVSNGDQGFLTNFNLTGGKMTSTGGGLYNINPGDTSAPSITSNASGTLSLISGGVAIRGGTLNVNVASGTTTSGVDLQISGVISGSALTKTGGTPGSGTLSLTGSNTYTGATNVNGGTLVFSGNGSVYTNGTVAGALNVASGATVRFDRNDALGGSNVISPVVVTVNGGILAGNNTYTSLSNPVLNGATINSNGGTNAAFPGFSLRGTVTVGGTTATNINVGTTGNGFNNVALGIANGGTDAVTFNVADATSSSAVDLNVNTFFSNQGSANPLIKTGAGTMALNGANTYTGATTVNAGTLLVNGSTVAASAVTVNNSGTVLGGIGTVSGATTINAGGNITGADIGSVGALTLQSTVAITGGTYAVDISGASADMLKITGALTLSGANITFTGTPTAPSYVLATFASETGAFAGTAPSGYSFQFNMAGTELDLVAVPEPATWFAGLLLVGAVVVSRRRQLNDWLGLARG